MKYDGSGFEDFGPIKEKIPINNGIMPIAYGYVLGAINREEKDNVDALIFSKNQFKTGDEVEVNIIGLLRRDDGDHKVIAVDDSVMYTNLNEISTEERTLILEYFGYNHKIMVEDQKSALEYLAECAI